MTCYVAGQQVSYDVQTYVSEAEFKVMYLYKLKKYPQFSSSPAIYKW